ncbi:hypothetical protein RGQ15_16395 [Paracoccus sp. MBLB3053]|uniref:DnaA N-terminal domain-containing protein n=1 Tax=Paracoccus aurantius TaxID=3073814 RepID=A0ABU2HVT7_9RHOB|nr:DnaA N-terminal domain-containing protein [Paracoccus sp. MBLB3053]MDS9469146.1 hypothetical protein [Paracoccus sp. MBLB3053]
MDPKRLTGPQAGSHKYDLLTAIALAGLNGTPGFQTSMLRLVTLVTARYNWKLDEVSVGQRDLARMWSVDERTVKREIKRLIEKQILLQLRQGVRGRVGAYRLNLIEIQRLSAPHWQNVGPDFSARMGTEKTLREMPEEKVVRVDFRVRSSENSPAWERTLSSLAQSDPGLHGAWFDKLMFKSFDDGLLLLNAPSAFVAQYILTHHLKRIEDLAREEFPGLRRISIAY